MTYDEFIAYLRQNSRIIDDFISKATTYMNTQNEQQEPEQRRAAMDIEFAVDGMRRQFTSDLYTNLHGKIARDHVNDEAAWIAYLEENDILDSVSESVAEMEFE
ncbi:hypothetical protein [Lacticaseibacillus saniviri]|uniref:Uncharacterized protein n=1 Tax=Lacticaseibacillus saniviri JCM 17471 = DSM 24301 TaxID=1293598 RepID=A0A0R2N474_9LACO|nr:hypothetical protein [Lacticaseibacillus saniviri]KRO18563.1 hypothetical protein IV56_GL000840 [Lacticaseibacillus saniviri JCM 17471 = DSM 24301]MCG4281535.1 hypothetical protein [Lacticaseibacillus saniviri]